MVVAFFDWRNLKMNDKNFIEELRQKREEYGVTQTRLAVACGISREYLWQDTHLYRCRICPMSREGFTIEPFPKK